MKLNLGCGEFVLPGYTNVDLQPPADIIGDFTEMTFSDVEEVVMSHVLEHLPWTLTVKTLRRVHSWCVPGAPITVEVPDMQAIIERGVFDHDAQIAIYGIQSAPGEFHMSGFTERLLLAALREGGFVTKSSSRFVSDHPARPGFPCVEATATA